MPQNKIEGAIPALYKMNALNLLMYGFVKGVRDTLHTLPIEQALEMFRVAFDIDEDDFNVESMKSAFHRTEKNLFLINKNT